MKLGLGRLAVLATTVMSPILGAAAAAQEANEDAITVIGRRSQYEQTDTSTATRTDTDLRDVPQAVTVITDDLIQDQGMRTMADVVRYVPGVTMGQGEGHRDAPTLRGNASTADFFVDGVRDDVQYYRDLYNVDRIEVLKGSNAMIFGRGGGGGVINRVTEWANWAPQNEVAVTFDAYDQLRGTADLGAAFGDSVAGRVNLVYEDSDSYRDHVSLTRWGVNPTLAVQVSPQTVFRFGYEHFIDERTVDRGVPSQNGRPWAGSRTAFFGNPDQSFAETRVDVFTMAVEHDFSGTLTLRNRTLFGSYDKFYQNIHANSAVNGLGNVTLQGYNSGTQRENLFTQTDLIWRVQTGRLGHTVLAGFEFGHQRTAATRSPNTAPGTVNVASPTVFGPHFFGAPLQTNSLGNLDLAAFYAQDQISIGDHWQVVAGVRYDAFELDFDDRRPANADFQREDDLVSPRLGVIYRPVEPLSFYASYSVSYLPQSGDQFGSLTATTANLEPEEFENTEVGLKWDVTPRLALTAALYRLDRSNTTALDPLSGLTVLTGAQRSEGFELGIAGEVTDSWQIAGGYAHQNVEITRTTTAAPAGRVVPLTPEHTFSLWNMVRFNPRWSAGLGVIHQSESFASISNAVTLPDFTRLDASIVFAINEEVEAQLNVENLLDEEYWATAHNDNNIMPGSPTAVRVTLRSRF